MVAPGTSLAVKLSQTGGRHHFDGVLGLSTSMKTGFIDVEVPDYSKWSFGWYTQTLQVLLAHKILAQEVASTPNTENVVRGAVDGEKGAQNARSGDERTALHSTASGRLLGRSSLVAY